MTHWVIVSCLIVVLIGFLLSSTLALLHRLYYRLCGYVKIGDGRYQIRHGLVYVAGPDWGMSCDIKTAKAFVEGGGVVYGVCSPNAGALPRIGMLPGAQRPLDAPASRPIPVITTESNATEREEHRIQQAARAEAQSLDAPVCQPTAAPAAAGPAVQPVHPLNAGVYEHGRAAGVEFEAMLSQNDDEF